MRTNVVARKKKPEINTYYGVELLSISTINLLAFPHHSQAFSQAFFPIGKWDIARNL